MSDPALFLGRFHPLIVHFPIALLLLAMLVEWIASRRPTSGAASLAGLILWLGSMSAVLSAMAGLLLGLSGTYAGQVYDRHMVLGLAIAATSTVSALMWSLRDRGARWVRAQQALLVLTVCLVIPAGHLGATLTHGEGFLSEYAPTPLRSLLGTGEAAARRPEGPVVVYDALVAPALQTRCVTCHGPAHGGADDRRGQAGRHRGHRELGQRLVEVPAHVIGQGLERRDVQDGGAVFEILGDGLAEELVETGEESGESLARARRGGEEDVAARRDQRPGARLNRGGLAEPLTKPALDDGVEHILSIGTPSRAGKRAPGRAVALRDLALEPRRDRRGGAGHVGLRLGRGRRLAQQPPAGELLTEEPQGEGESGQIRQSLSQRGLEFHVYSLLTT